MRPVAIFQHDKTQRAGYLLSFLQRRGIPTRMFQCSEGEDVPRDASEFSGLVFLGSNCSVNDPLPWIRRELALVKDALAHDVPVLGHCFGGQLLASALGATVARNPVACIGWDTLHVTPAAARWFGGAKEVAAFNWHYESFAIPRGATRTLFGTYCLNKGFSYGRHLGFQCHFEVTEEIVREWCSVGHDELQVNRCGSVQREEQILAGLKERMHLLHMTSHAVYVQWLSGLPQGDTALAFACEHTQAHAHVHSNTNTNTTTHALDRAPARDGWLGEGRLMF